MMYNVNEADKIYRQKLKEDNLYAQRFMDRFREKMPDEFAKAVFEEEYGCHIIDRDMYDKAVSYFEWSNDKGMGAKWSVEDIEKLSGIDFDDKDYYLLDYAYVVNMLYSDYGHIFSDPSYYLKMAKAYLEDPDYCGDPDERAYKNAVKRIRYHEDKLEK